MKSKKFLPSHHKSSGTKMDKNFSEVFFFHFYFLFKAFKFPTISGDGLQHTFYSPLKKKFPM